MLKLRNTLTKTTEPKEFLSEKEILNRAENRRFVSMYTCGPTVYDYASIGNFSAYLMADLVKRYLRYLGYPVKHVINITDVGHLVADADVAGEDKLEMAAKKEGTDPQEIAEKYTTQFLKDAALLHIEADVWPRATDHVPEMIKLIEVLLQKGYAYKVDSGVYFDVSEAPNYGTLSGNTLSQLKAGARVEVHPDKKHAADFALWKLNQPNHLQQWDSPFGRGYPGWHIECSAMSMKYLGEQIDIHTGGEDNIFPHHESEIVQSECATGVKPFVHYWLHRQFMTVDGKKMSKSLKNTYRLQDLLDEGYEPEDFRMFILSAHYRTGVNFSWDGLKAARERRLRWVAAVLDITEGKVNDVASLVTDRFLEAMNDDLNTPEAFAYIDYQVKDQNTQSVGSLKFWQDVEKLFQLGLFTYSMNVSEKITISDEVRVRVDHTEPEILISELIRLLEDARSQKNYELADKIRAEIVKNGYSISILSDGTVNARKR